ncbi:MAG: DUF4203 domain-containing protein [Verrucomicrobia bacterium]|nr:DUF4203 domain-containing protein [Verrucomicrobiota bacterium]
MNPDFSALPLENLPWWVPGAVVLAFGLITCLHGYKILKAVLFMLGLTSGLYAGLLYAPLIFPEQPNLVWIVAGVLGLALGVLMNFFYKAGVFILGAYAGGVVFLPFLQSLQDVAAIGVLVVAILVGGFAALLLEKWAMKIATSAIGAWHAVQSSFFVLKLSPFLFPWEQVLDKYGGASLHDIFDRPWYFWTSVIGLFLGGLYMQVRGKRKKE